MKLKKLKLIPKKQTTRKIRRDNRVLTAGLALSFAVGLLFGGLAIELFMLSRPYNQHPKNVVIAADNTVSIPKDLIDFLKLQDECKNYRGKSGPAGVGLYSVYQISRAKFAKVSYGCSTSLSNYIMAVKDNNQWHFIPIKDYFSTAGFLPKCIQVEKYQIDKSIEPFCIKEDGMARDNGVK